MGEWTNDGKHIYDPDFTHDVALVVNGDFADVGERNAYSDRLTNDLNEINRLRACMKRAGLACFMRDGTPEQVAEHMAHVAESHVIEITRLRAEVERLKGYVKHSADCARGRDGDPAYVCTCGLQALLDGRGGDANERGEGQR